MTTNAPIRNSTKRFDTPFLFLASAELLDQARRVARENQTSMAAFIRQAVKRNVTAYENTK